MPWDEGMLSANFEPGTSYVQFAVSFHGPTWITGGEFGLEASVPSLAMLILWIVIFSTWLPGNKYPNPGAVARTITPRIEPTGGAAIIAR